MTIADLIERLEKATEGSKELDRLVARHAGWHRVEPKHARSKRGAWISPDDFMGVYSTGAPILDGLHGTTLWADPPAFSSSIDSALTLVPEGFQWQLRSVPTEEGFDYSAQVDWRPNLHQQAATPAIALCIAALKARAGGVK
jgi:hypothetical protein